MKIDSMDAANVSFSNQKQYAKAETQDTVQNTVQKQNNDIYSLDITHLTPLQKELLPISEKIVIEAIEKANKAISGPNTRFEYSIHEQTKEIMLRVIDSDTNKIIREIPPEKILDMVAKLWELAGIIVDERR